MRISIVRIGILLAYGTGSIFAKNPLNLTQPKAPNQKTVAEWTVVCYMQADNNLAPYAEYNVRDMQSVGSTKDVNILVQWDQPMNRKTWRYYIQKGKKVDAGSLNQEMGINPEKELVDMMKWASTKYPAKQYMLILWNHGNGVSDLKKQLKNHVFDGWLQIPGLMSTREKERGILYDDSQHTFLTNQALTRVCQKIKTLLGKNIDVVAMDACLMAMLEVAYDMKDTVNTFVGSQETIPGEGFPYSLFLSALTTQPTTINSEDLGKIVVSAYDNFYSDDSTHTLSSLTMSKLATIGQAFNNVATELMTCFQQSASDTKTLLQAVRSNAVSFYVDDYVDLYTIYTGLLDQIKKFRTSSKDPKKNKLAKEYGVKGASKISFNRLETAVNAAQAALLDGIALSLNGSNYTKAKGMSIYFPQGSTLDSTYAKTSFAQTTQWLNVLKKMGKS